MTNRRASRVNDLLREELSELIRREIRDPRLADIVSITRVAVSADLRTAKVFISTLGGEMEKRQTLQALRAAAGFLQRGLKPRISLKSTPILSFVQDDSIERGARLLTLINEFDLPKDKTP